MQVKDYKPHIDGLRALAVIPVIFFHAGFNSFQGGFVGVDVFFVISGYLITKIILKDVSKNKFIFRKFYLRRARRLLPVLFIIILITIPISIYLMGNKELYFYSKQIFSVIFFISNFFFWKNLGYFESSTEIQPLLHTWSLAVEEQFYIFFPILIFLIFKFYKKKIFFFFILITFMSLFLSQMGGNFKIDNLSNSFPFFILPFEFFWQAGSANFYLPFGRVWELLIGAIIAFSFKKKKIKEIKINNYLSSLGFLIIIISVMFYSKNIQYPSIFTLLPCLGTALIIIFTDKKTILFKILTFKPIVFLGLISYSLYLWHQPLFAFNRIYFGADLSNNHLFLLIIISLILSIFSWYFIEQPFRNRKRISDKNFLRFLSLLTLSILILTSLIYFEKINSYKKQLPENLKKTIKYSNNDNCFGLKDSHLEIKEKWYCLVGNKKSKISFVVLGDSHASVAKPGFELAALDKNKKGILTGYAGCPSLLNTQSIRPDTVEKNCKLLTKKVFNFIKKNEIKKIFLVGRWTYYTGQGYSNREFQPITNDNKLFSNIKNSREAFLRGLQDTIKAYNDINVDLIFVHQVPMQIYDPEFAYLNSYNFTKQNVDLNKLEMFSVDRNKSKDLQKFVRDDIKNLKNEYSFKVIDLFDLFCNKKKCLMGSKNFSYYSDDDHLSIKGAELLKNKISYYLD